MTRTRWFSYILIAACCWAGNLHLPIFQIVAWANMLIAYQQDNTFAEALEMTFNGEHPCPMCLAIRQQQVRQHGEWAPTYCLERIIWFCESDGPNQYTWPMVDRIANLMMHPIDIAHPPLVPPPRFSC